MVMICIAKQFIEQVKVWMIASTPCNVKPACIQLNLNPQDLGDKLNSYMINPSNVHLAGAIKGNRGHRGMGQENQDHGILSPNDHNRKKHEKGNVSNTFTPNENDKISFLFPNPTIYCLDYHYVGKSSKRNDCHKCHNPLTFIDAADQTKILNILVKTKTVYLNPVMKTKPEGLGKY